MEKDDGDVDGRNSSLARTAKRYAAFCRSEPADMARKEISPPRWDGCSICLLSTGMVVVVATGSDWHPLRWLPFDPELRDQRHPEYCRSVQSFSICSRYHTGCSLRPPRYHGPRWR